MKVVQNTEHGGQRGAAQGTEEGAGSLFAGAGGEERRLLQHHLAHRGRKAGSASPHYQEACRSPRSCPFGADSWRRGQGWLNDAATTRARSTAARMDTGSANTGCRLPREPRLATSTASVVRTYERSSPRP